MLGKGGGKLLEGCETCLHCFIGVSNCLVNSRDGVSKFLNNNNN